MVAAANVRRGYAPTEMEMKRRTETKAKGNGWGSVLAVPRRRGEE
uniref:Uncharacterized protein n=1 Tax=Cucumis melo TaxID=3656 RepID=A0A9I9CD26_CUCME